MADLPSLDDLEVAVDEWAAAETERLEAQKAFLETLDTSGGNVSLGVMGVLTPRVEATVAALLTS